MRRELSLSAGLLIGLALAAMHSGRQVLRHLCEVREPRVLSFAVYASTYTEETMKEWVLYVMTWASQLSGYPFPDSLPEVQWKSEIWFSHRACKDHIPCPVYGLYEDRNVVYLREDLTDSAKDHIAVHEFVHYLQHHSGRFDLYSCIDTDRREREAFRAQSRFIAEARGGFTMFGTPPMPCDGKGSQR
jgi:hypothetical protein